MYRCYECGQPLMRPGAHCHMYGCGWQNPAFVAEEVALMEGNPELAEEIALASGDYATAVAIEIAEDFGNW